VTVGPSPLSGQGLFARAPIALGEIVVIWGGLRVSAAELAAMPHRRGSAVAIDDGLYLVGRADDPPDPADSMNHACDPTVWLSDAVTLVARRPLAAGDELTADYAMWEGDEAWVSAWACRCGATDCRTRIRGTDWRRPDLQARYAGHFSPFLLRRIGVTARGEAAP
jgi:hypothetical protein